MENEWGRLLLPFYWWNWSPNTTWSPKLPRRTEPRASIAHASEILTTLQQCLKCCSRFQNLYNVRWGWGKQLKNYDVWYKQSVRWPIGLWRVTSRRLIWMGLEGWAWFGLGVGWEAAEVAQNPPSKEGIFFAQGCCRCPHMWHLSAHLTLSIIAFCCWETNWGSVWLSDSTQSPS